MHPVKEDGFYEGLHRSKIEKGMKRKEKFNKTVYIFAGENSLDSFDLEFFLCSHLFYFKMHKTQ